jgi:hypothetical protein
MEGIKQHIHHTWYRWRTESRLSQPYSYADKDSVFDFRHRGILQLLRGQDEV